MGSPLGPLMANAMLCSIEEKVEKEGKIPDDYNRYVVDTLSSACSLAVASNFHQTLNNAHPSLSFTMEIEKDGMLPFLGMLVKKDGSQMLTQVYRKPTNTGLMLHYQSHVDNRYKRGLIKTMPNRAKKFSSSFESIKKECEEIRAMFANLYPNALVDSIVSKFEREHYNDRWLIR